MIRTQRSSARYFQRPDADYVQVDSSATSMGGYYAMMDLSRQAGSVQGKLAVAALSPGYEVNDMGFQTETDRYIIDSDVSYNRPRPGNFFRNWRLWGSPDFKWNSGGDVISSELQRELQVAVAQLLGRIDSRRPATSPATTTVSRGVAPWPAARVSIRPTSTSLRLPEAAERLGRYSLSPATPDHGSTADRCTSRTNRGRRSSFASGPRSPGVIPPLSTSRPRAMLSPPGPSDAAMSSRNRPDDGLHGDTPERHVLSDAHSRSLRAAVRLEW